MKKNLLLLSLLFLLFWFFNYCTPLIFDDYVYSYIWTAGNMERPLAESAQRINSFADILQSQWNHYFTWGGRAVAHILAQFFLWKGKNLFSFINTFCFILLLLEMQWIIDKGKISINFRTKDLFWLFSVLWLFSIMMGDIFVWLTLSCNYLWTTVIILAFLLAYEYDFFYLTTNSFFYRHSFLMFLFGIIAGWTNENVPCFVSLLLGYYTYNNYKAGNNINWQLTGLVGLIIGYVLLIAAPGNYVRYNTLLEHEVIRSGLPLLQYNFIFLAKILLLRIILLFYVIKNLIYIYKVKLNRENTKIFIVSVAFFFLSVSSLAIMIISPELRFRSSFPGLIFLILSAGLIRSIKNSLQQSNVLLNKGFFINKGIRVICTLYVILTLVTSIYMYNLQRQQTNFMLSQIYNEKENPSGQTLVVMERPYILKDAIFYHAITGFHLIFPYSILTDEQCWINKDISIYYGITAIRTKKGEAYQ